MGCSFWIWILVFGAFVLVLRTRTQEPYESPNCPNSLVLTRNKAVTSRILQLNGVPCPRFFHVREPCTDAQKLGSHLEQLGIGFPLVVKDTSSSEGRHVHVNLSTYKDVCATISRVLEERPGHTVIVEEQVFGKDFRVLVIGGRVWDVLVRVPPSVVGDGRRSVEHLIDHHNDVQIQKGLAPTRNITWPYIAEQLGLEEPSVSALRAHVLPAGRALTITRVRNHDNGSFSNRIPLGRVHRDNIVIFERITRLLGLELAGIDFLSPDIGKSYQEMGYVIEVNAHPGTKAHGPAEPQIPEFDKQFEHELGLLEGPSCGDF